VNYKKNNNGGPAFPSRANDLNGDPRTGMTLRDYFAAKIIQAIISTHRPSASGTEDGDMLSTENINRGGVPVNSDGDRTPFDLTLRWAPAAAYALADAMLAAREAKQ
jgi:hypothetical protein